MHRRLARLSAATILSVSTLVAASPSGFAQSASERPELNPMSRVPALREEMDDSDRVFGGKEAAKGAWPFQVALLTSDMLDDDAMSQPDAQFCGGSLIAPQWVLTAAHCLNDGGQPIDPSTVTLLIGATDLSEGVRIPAEKVIVHEGYSEMTLDNDIGLIKLAKPAPAGSKTIALPQSDVAAGKVTVVGWGMMETGSFPSALMETEIELFPNQSCNAGIKEIYAKDLNGLLRDYAGRMRVSEADVDRATQAIAATMQDPLTNNMICAGVETGARDACNGDSGGPLFLADPKGPTQIGIVSWGEGPMDAGAACGHENAYGVYTRLVNYTGWIKQHMDAK